MRSLSEVEQLLAQQIPPDVVHPPDKSRGIFGDYITAQYAMQKANEIFGIDGIADMELVSSSQIELQKPNLPFGDWIFTCMVKIWVRTTDGELTPRLGQGVGVAQAPFNQQEHTSDPVRPSQIDTAIKAALSDAIKNAFMRYGQALGAELYFDERTTQVLGYEIESERAEKMAERAQANLADETCPEGGWGTDKKFGGMTLAEIYADADGFGAMQWAATRAQQPRGFTAKMAEYFNLMQERGEEAAEEVRQSTTQAKSGKVVKMWYGEEKPVDETVDWRKLVANPGFVSMLTEKFNPDDSIPNFGPDHPRMKNHYKRHFHVDNGRELTWNMLQALYTFCKEGSEAAAFGWPEYYAGDRAPTEQTLEKEKEVTDDPMILIGPRGQQKIPASLQVLAREATDGDPDEWLWAVMGEKKVDEWTPDHTAQMKRLIESVIKNGVGLDVAAIMWEVGLGQLKQQ